MLKPWIVGTMRWAARLASIVSIGLLAMFLFGEFGSPTPTETVALALFPGGVAAGMAIGWWRERLGGLVTLFSLAAFYLWIIAQSGRAPGGPYFLLFAAPGLVFLICARLDRRRAALAAPRSV